MDGALARAVAISQHERKPIAPAHRFDATVYAHRDFALPDLASQRSDLLLNGVFLRTICWRGPV
jgi:hypothetical protein